VDVTAIGLRVRRDRLHPTLTPLTDPTTPVDIHLNFGMVDVVLQSRDVWLIVEGTSLDDWTESPALLTPPVYGSRTARPDRPL